jgi:hypothetical protein
LGSFRKNLAAGSQRFGFGGFPKGHAWFTTVRVDECALADS